MGLVTGAHGLRGELRVRPETDFPERFARTPEVWVVPPRGEPGLRRITGSRLHSGKGLVLLRLEGVEDRDTALAFRGAQLYVRESDLVPLAEGQYYEFQIRGLAVVTEDGRDLGPVIDILHTGANDVYETPTALIPAIESVLREVDLEQGRLVIRWVEGLLK